MVKVQSREESYKRSRELSADTENGIIGSKRATDKTCATLSEMAKSGELLVKIGSWVDADIEAFCARVDNYFLDQQQKYIEHSGAKEIHNIRKCVYTIQGVCRSLGIATSTFANMEKDVERRPLIAKACTMARQFVVERTLEGGISGELNASMTKFQLTNISEMSDKKETQNTNLSMSQSVNYVVLASNDDFERFRDEFGSDEDSDDDIIDIDAESTDGTGSAKVNANNEEIE